MLGACDPNPPPEPDATLGQENLLQLNEPAERVQAHVYLDATVSMAGYVAPQNSVYARFIEELETALLTGWQQADVDFNKFGTTVRELEGRAQYRAAREASFYTEEGISEVTQIDSVITCRGGSEVGIVITDLFQNDGDVQAIVQNIKQKCFQRGVSVGILGVLSQFEGTVYDARVPPYRYASSEGDVATYRPFYVLMFGEAANLHRLYQLLQSSPLVDGEHFVLISDRVVQDYEMEVTKPAESTGLSANAPLGPRQFSFTVRDEEEGGVLEAEVRLSPYAAAPAFRIENVRLTAFRQTLSRSGAAAAPVETDDVVLENLTREGDTLHATLQLDAPAEPGRYLYQLALVTGPLDGFQTPAWVGSLSSSNPTPATDPNRTLNLERFITDLRRASSSISQPVLASWEIHVSRR